MALNLNSIYDAMIELCVSQVGGSLATLPTGTPAIARDRSDLPQLPYPHITVDIPTIVEDNGWSTNKKPNPDDPTSQIIDTSYRLLFTYRVYDVDGDAMQIAQNLFQSFTKEQLVRDLVDDHGIAVITVDNCQSIPYLNRDKYIDSVLLSMTLTVTGTVIDEGVGRITSIILDGKLYRHLDDQDPLEIDIDTSIP